MRVFAIIAAALLALAAFTAVFAHAEPATVKPGDGAVLNAAPSQVAIQMTQEMARQAGANDIQVFDAAGKQVTTAAAVIDNSDRRKISVALPSGLAVGTYTVKWKTLSADDGDTANGQLSFTYDPSKPPSAGTENIVSLAGGASPAAAGPASSVNPLGGGSGGGTSWVLVTCVAVGMFALGSGGTFLLIRRKPA